MHTRALCTFGVWNRGFGDDLPDERGVLATADEFRGDYCAIQQARHDAMTALRDRLFPDLFAAMREHEAIGAKIYELEREIKQHHSDARNRNAVTETQRQAMEALRESRKASGKRVADARAKWVGMMREFSAWWKTLADWKNVKTLAKRKALYASIEPPEHLADYARVWMESDLAVRELSESFSDRLHSSIRAEIIEASQPKLGKDAPGVRYRFGQRPEPGPWRKLTLQIAGGATLDELLGGAIPSLKFSVHRETERKTVYRVHQQIGTSANPCRIVYYLVADRPIPRDCVIQRWTLIVRENGKREAVPLVKTNEVKPTGTGDFGYRISWSMRKEGIEVARFWGSHINERLILPAAKVAARMALEDRQSECDREANELLSELGAAPPPGKVQGVDALREYAAKPDVDPRAANLLESCDRRLHTARNTARRAMRSIEHIYRTVARRVCSLHARVASPRIDLKRAKLYDERDLLRVDVLPKPSRRILHAVAPGKLTALLDGYGLASVEVVEPPAGDARETDLFSSYVRGLGSPRGNPRGGKKARSRMATRLVETA